MKAVTSLHGTDRRCCLELYWIGRRRRCCGAVDLSPLQKNSATSQLLAFGPGGRGQRAPRNPPPPPEQAAMQTACVRGYANPSNLAVSARTRRVKLLLRRPQRQLPPPALNGVRRPFPLNVSTGCCAHTVRPTRLIMNDWLINRDY